MGMIAEVGGQVYVIVLIIFAFDSVDGNEFEKDFDLLTTTTQIALGAYVCDIMLKTSEEK